MTKSLRDRAVGRFTVDIEVANFADIVKAREGSLPAAQVRRLTLQGVVDSGAGRFVLPAAVVKQLGLLVDCTHKRLVPRDPRFQIAEIE